MRQIYHKTFKYRHSSRRGLTLIELLAVIGIIGILLAILIPMIAGMRDRAREAQAAQNLRSIHNAAMLFVSDNNGRFPTLRGTAEGGAWTDPWPTQLSPYLPDGARTGGWEARLNPAYFCPKVEGKVVAYAMNDNIIRAIGFEADMLGFPAVSVQDPAKELLLFEAAPSSNVRTGGRWHAWADRIVSGDFDYAVTIARRHGQESDPAFYGVFVDGQVRRFNFNEFAEDLPLRRALFSAGSNNRSIYR
jgi:prepilin-type N-terminal cleavage/methylation domain-containing protein